VGRGAGPTLRDRVCAKGAFCNKNGKMPYVWVQPKRAQSREKGDGRSYISIVSTLNDLLRHNGRTGQSGGES